MGQPTVDYYGTSIKYLQKLLRANRLPLGCAPHAAFHFRSRFKPVDVDSSRLAAWLAGCAVGRVCRRVYSGHPETRGRRDAALLYISGVSLPSQGFNNGVSRGIIFNSIVIRSIGYSMRARASTRLSYLKKASWACVRVSIPSRRHITKCTRCSGVRPASRRLQSTPAILTRARIPQVEN